MQGEERAENTNRRSAELLGKVYVTRRVFDEAITLLSKLASVEGNDTDRVLTPDELRSAARDAEGVLALLTDRIDVAFLDACPKLRVVSNFAVGYNNVDLAAATERGVLITNTPGVLTDTTADFAWTLLMAAARRVVEGDRFVREGKFDAWGPQMLLGHDVHGKTLGLIGMGRIGQAVARRATGFDMRILYHDANPVSPEALQGLGAEPAELDQIYRTADFISVHVPLLRETRHLLDDAAFGRMKPNCIVVNTSRGPVIDEQALVRALGSGTIAAAGIDVYEHEPEVDPGLIALPNAVLAPHIASASYQTRRRMCMMASESLIQGLNGQRPANLVNSDAWPRRRQ
jgi:glyoxylate reductase